MKRFWKIFFITLVSLFAVLLVTICIVLYLVFTPERFTPIVRSEAGKFITCKSEIGNVELTFFSTFPKFGIKISHFALINPVADSKFDTLVKADELTGVIDAVAWWKRNELILNGLELTGGSVNVFSDSLGRTNYDIMATDTVATPETESDTLFPLIDIKNVSLNDIDFHYKDLALKLNTVIRDLSARISGTVTSENINGEIKVNSSLISLDYDGVEYLNQASIRLDLPVDVIPSQQFITLKNAAFSINDLKFLLDGSVENDTLRKRINTDLKFEFSSWQVSKLISLVPSAFNSYLKGIEADGILSSQGNIKGSITDSGMPVLDIRLLLDNGTVKYSGFPIPLHDIAGDVTLHTDMKTDSLSYLDIKKFDAGTPLSHFSTEGRINHLFSDIYCNLTTAAGLILEEFNPVIPDSMKVYIKGKASGRIKSAFSMSQATKMQLERMKLSGSLTLSDFNLDYDSISLSTSRSKIDFALPNNRAASKNTAFATATLAITNLKASKLESYSALLRNASVTFETSDARDTTRIPDFICSFSMDSLSANMDTLSIAVAKPNGKVIVSPRPHKQGQPRIILSYSSKELKTIFGKSSFAVNTMSFNTDILNDNTQKDIFLQWPVTGFIDLNQGSVSISGYSHPIGIPSLQMNFDPETFNIIESIIRIDKSDFQLAGNLNNISSYFRGDSILRGKLNFISNTTDVSQLMALTNGLGNKDSTITQKPVNQDTDTTYTGPYMVPSRMDLALKANIGMATMGVDTATNIAGNVLLHNGVLVLDGLTFDTPAARMQLTAIYRTPRKNHLFLGLDYHMFDVEISKLLTMIPDIDSLMPMLRSFSGKGEFHIAVETYLDSMYNMKKSTLRGASSIKGNDLVLMDGETFGEIAKTLKFSKKTENKVDSLSAEFTIFRNEIDVYPFLLVMDKYKAVIVGRHNFDLTYDYHISVVDCPLPIKLGIDVKGNADNMTYDLTKCRYAEFYRPSSRHVVENKRIELRQMIREALTQKIKE